MKRSKYLIVVFVLIAAALLYFLFQDSLPPRTPRKIARNISGLNITSAYRIASFNEEWSDFNGDGSLQIEIDLDDSQFAKLITECNEKGYQNLPIINPPLSLQGALFLKDLEGLYKIRIHGQEGTAYDLVILDKKKKRLTVYVFVS